MPDKHLSSQFDSDLNSLCSKLLEMGGMVESQTSTAMRAFTEMDLDICNQVIEREKAVNDFEIEVDSACTEIIARRQPTARDLRLVMAVSKAIANLERAGDEAERVAKRTKRIIEAGLNHNINVAEIKISGQMATSLLRRSLDAFARLDTIAAAEVVKEDKQIDEEFRAFVRKLIVYMMEDPSLITTGLDMLTIAKAIERIGDHSKNIAEFVIYIVKGADVRHIPHADLVREVNR
ncbi:MAG: phosphate transport system regulatory protein PhoU [Burkholderiaceae bacterium]|jgi:phosphate transport system protein|nr:phosphate transport system regulatory protein PhoU [Burkholderiaceae bacterium]